MNSLLRLLAHPARREIVRALADGELCVSALQERLGQRQAYVSQQLAYLRDANLVRCREEGVHIYYSLADPTCGAIVNAIYRMCAALEGAPQGCTFLVRGTAPLPHLLTALYVVEEGAPCRVVDLVAYAARPTALAHEAADVVAAFGMSGQGNQRRRGCAQLIADRLSTHGYETIQTCRVCPSLAKRGPHATIPSRKSAMHCGTARCTEKSGCGRHYCCCGYGCRCDSTRKRRPQRRGPPLHGQRYRL